MKKVIFLLSFWLYFAQLLGQEAGRKLTIYNVEDGLSQSSVQSLTQDIYGYLWVSTGNGLNCFDGKNFINYFPPIDPNSSYSANRIRKVLCDDIGNLWIGSDEGLFYFNRITSQIEDPLQEIKKLKEGFCYPLFLTPDTINVLIADSSILSIDIRDHKFRTTHLNVSFSVVYSLAGEAGQVMAVSPTSELWLFSTRSGKLDIQNFKFEKLFFNYVADIKFFKDNKCFILFDDRLALVNLATGEIEPNVETNIPIEKRKSIFRSITYLKSKEVWIGTSNQGIFVLDSTLKYKYQISTEINQSRHQLQLKNISNIYEDRESNIWIATDSYGLGLLSMGNLGIRLMNLETPVNGKLSSDFIWSFYEDDENSLWIGTFNEGLNKWNRKTNTIEYFLLSEKKTFPTPNDIHSICPVSSHELLIGTSCGIWFFDKKSHHSYPISIHFNEENIRRTRNIISIEKNLFIAQIQGRCYFIEKRDASWSFDTIPIPESIAINLLYKSSEGKIFGFAGEGFYEINRGGVRYNAYSYHSNQIKIRVNSVAELNNDTIYAATDKGLAEFDFTGHINKMYSTREGLPNHYLYGVLIDGSKNLWISSNKGLSRFNSSGGKFDNYGMGDGLQSFEFNSGATYKNQRGEMFFGGINGFNYFHPDSMYSSQTFPVVVFSGIKVNDLAFLPDSSLSAKKILNLAYNQKTITFEFNAIEFTNPGHITFFCQLEGWDKEWVELGTSTFIRYSKLPPGKYTFQAKAVNRQGGWSKAPAQLILVIARPFWMKPWFILLAASFIIGIIVLTVYYLLTVRIRRRLRILERQREISLIRSRISSDLHDDIGSGLSKLAMLSDTSISKIDGNPEIVQQFKKVSVNARRLIDQLRVIVWTLNPQYDQLESLVSYIHQQAGDFLDNSPLRATFILPKNIPSIIVTPETKRNIHYTVMEVLHNAIKHSGSKEIFLEISTGNKYLEISIRDTGIGFDPCQISGFGNGLHFIKKRMKDINGQITIASSIGSGTTVTITATL